MHSSCSHWAKAAAFAIAFAAALLSSAQPSAAIGISPGRIELDFSPGQNTTYTMSVIGGSYGRINVVSRPSERCGLSVPFARMKPLDPGAVIFSPMILPGIKVTM